MSYQLYTWRAPGESAYECGERSLLLVDTRKAWSRITLVGKGEHEGTNLTLTKEHLFVRPFADERELGAHLDHLFLRAHHDRLSAQRGDKPAETGGRRKTGTSENG